MLKFQIQVPLPPEYIVGALGPLLVGLGITIDPYHYLGGLVMAIGASMLAWKVVDGEQRQAFWRVLLAAVLVATVMAELHQIALTKTEAGWFWSTIGSLPIQLLMAVSGFLSGWLIRTSLRVGGRLETQAETITDRVLNRFLPGGDK